MAKDGYFFRFASKVHSVYRVPSKSIMLQCLIAIIIVLSGTLDKILTYMGFSLGIFPILAVIGVFKLRHLKKSEYKMPGFPVIPIIYILAGASILILGFLEAPLPSLIAILTVAAGIPAYFIFKRIYKK
jgi:APA family basic amino acid/polyamine antiporter